MPDLPNMGNFKKIIIKYIIFFTGVERDLESFKEFFENPDFRADGLKIYPTLVIRGTGLYELWKNGKYRNYHPSKKIMLMFNFYLFLFTDALVEIIAKLLALVPPWTRVYRI